MRRVQILLIGVLVLAVVAGCGGGRDVDIEIHVGDQATGTVSTEATAPPPQPTATTAAAPTAAPTEVVAEATVQPPEPTAVPTEAAPTAEPAAPTAAPTSEPPTPPPPLPTDTPAPPPPPPPTEAPAAPDDQYTLDPSQWEQSLATLSSFRQKVNLVFRADGTGLESRLVYEGEVTTNPTALHSTLRVEGEAASQLPSNQVEVIWIGDRAWVKVGRKPWVPVTVSALESEYDGQVLGVGELLPFIQQAQRVMPDETINGIPCKHYTYNLDNLQAEAGMTSAAGDIWVAKDGGYVVRLTMKGQGTYYGTYTSSGSLDLVYDLYDVNAPITIKPPR